MDIKNRIKEFIDERGWTIYELSKRSSLDQTTISQFFAEGDMVELTPEQRAFFTRWAVLSAGRKEMLMNLVNSIK